MDLHRQAQPPPSVIDSLGTELIGVMSPVSICMLLVIFILSFTSTTSSSPGAAPIPVPSAATLVYQEAPSDPPSTKLIGAILDAAAFVALVAVVTFLLVLLYYYRCTSFLKNYMRFSAFFVLAAMGGALALSFLRRAAAPLDAASALLLLFNFAAVGVVAVLSPAAPILLRQAYLVLIAAVVAAWFARLPEWTTWVMLLALAAYDLVAVLAPRGPLRILVEMASSRDDDLPALVYEARPPASAHAAPRSVELQPASNPRAPGQIGDSAVAVIEMQPFEGETLPLMPRSSSPSHRNRAMAELQHPEGETLQLMPSTFPVSTSIATHADAEIENVETETEPLVPDSSSGSGSTSSNAVRQQPPPSPAIELFDSSRGIRLGLGDFVFYSVLVGRAAMYDLTTVYACYLAIISGLGCTLILLSVHRQALPALPISITLGVVFYFLTRLLMEPFVVGASTNLVMF